MTDLKAEVYYLKLSDTNGCVVIDSVEVHSPNELEVISQINHCIHFGVIQGFDQVELDDGVSNVGSKAGLNPTVISGISAIIVLCCKG